MGNTLTIRIIDDRHLRLVLSRGRTHIGQAAVAVDRNLDTVLIAAIDKFLKRNRIPKSSLTTVKAVGAIDKFSSVYRIVKAYQLAFQSVLRG